MDGHGSAQKGYFEAGAQQGRAPHLLHVFPSFGIGGVPLRIVTVINHLGSAFRHTIVALDANCAAGDQVDAHVDAALLPVAADKTRPLQALATYRKALAGTAPDLLLTYNWGAIEWGLVNMMRPVCPHIHFESGFGPEEADRQLMRRVLFRRLVLSRAHALVVPSQTLYDLATQVWKIPEARVQHVPNGVDCVRFAAEPDPAAIAGFTRQQGELIVGTLAPLRREKNIARLLDAFAGLTGAGQVRLLIVGDGPERASLMRHAERLAIADRVIFAGHVQRPERVLGLMDLFVMSSDTEQMPNALLQAMAAGRAVASVAVGDVKAMLSPENRPFAVARDEEGALTVAMAELLRDAALRLRLGRCNQDHARRHYDMPQMFAAYRALFATDTAVRFSHGMPNDA